MAKTTESGNVTLDDLHPGEVFHCELGYMIKGDEGIVSLDDGTMYLDGEHEHLLPKDVRRVHELTLRAE
jgi:hypothetical protein